MNEQFSSTKNMHALIIKKNCVKTNHAMLQHLQRVLDIINFVISDVFCYLKSIVQPRDHTYRALLRNLFGNAAKLIYR